MSGKNVGRGRGRGSSVRAAPSAPAPGAAAAGRGPLSDTPRPGVDRSRMPGREMVWDMESTESKEQQQLIPYAKRPGQGKNGEPIELRVNYFQLLFKFRGPIHLYRVEFQTGRGAKPLLSEQKQAAVAGWLQEHFGCDVFADMACNFVYDGAKCLFAKQKLDIADKEVGMEKGCRVSAQVPGEAGTTNFIMRFHYATTVNQISADLTKLLAPDANMITGLDFVDAIVRQNPSHPILQKALVTAGRNFFVKPEFSDQKPIELDGLRYCLFGASVNTRVGLNGKIYLGVDVANSVFFRPVSCLEFMVQALNEANNTSAFRVEQLTKTTELQLSHRDQLRKYIKGLKVDMLYFKGQEHKNRTRTITKVGDGANATSFQLAEGTTTTVEEYFAKHHKIVLQYPTLPLLVFGTGARTCSIPIELCSIAPFQRCTGTLPESATSSMIRALCTTAPKRVGNILAVANGSKLGMDPWCKSFEIERDPSMAKLKGRVLQPPNIQYQNRTERTIGGVWCDKPQQAPRFLVPKQIKGVVVVRLCEMRDLNDGAIHEAIGSLYRVANSVGFGVPNNPSSTTAIINAGRDYQEVFPRNILPKMIQTGASLMIVVMSARNSQQYGFVKRFCETEHNFPSQCLLVKNLRPLKPMTALNLLLKINVKLEGCNWDVPRDQFPDTMIAGLDVTHPGGRDARVPSLAAVVGSLENFSRYGATVKVNRKGQETTNYIVDAIRERLDEYQAVNKKYPKSIIVFRDGVAQNMFQEVLSEELVAMRKAAENVGLSDVKFTFIVCQKRHHTRFFCENPKDQSGKGQNVPPGTVVDNDVVDGQLFDYFLCSHFGIQGTSRPCHYTVLHDDNQHSTDNLEQLSYTLCHAYARCSRSVGIPAPVYYADKVAERAKYHLLDFLNKLQSGALESESERSGSILHQRQESMEKITTISEDLKRSMYFC